jgi:hypothetical protein
MKRQFIIALTRDGQTFAFCYERGRLDKLRLWLAWRTRDPDYPLTRRDAVRIMRKARDVERLCRLLEARQAIP